MTFGNGNGYMFMQNHPLIINDKLLHVEPPINFSDKKLLPKLPIIIIRINFCYTQILIVLLYIVTIANGVPVNYLVSYSACYWYRGLQFVKLRDSLLIQGERWRGSLHL